MVEVLFKKYFERLEERRRKGMSYSIWARRIDYLFN